MEKIIKTKKTFLAKLAKTAHFILQNLMSTKVKYLLLKCLRIFSLRKQKPFPCKTKLKCFKDRQLELQFRKKAPCRLDPGIKKTASLL